MNKRIILSILLLFLSITVVIITIFITRDNNNNNNNNNNSIIKKGYEIFGNDYCDGHHLVEYAGQAFTSWTCKICGYKGEHNNTATPVICVNCASITGRCSKCGKLLKDK